MSVLGVQPIYQIIALCTLLVWPIFMFSYLHDRMHVENFWMTRAPVLKTWFLSARRMHDIHHRSVDNQGLMDTNFGIGFYFFDRLFRTRANRHRRFNWAGYRAAVERYGLDEAGLYSLRGCSKELFHSTTAAMSTRAEKMHDDGGGEETRHS
jgi:sterol desaturase/sphingolipid hydroxylase (fatty acid hydroxylase superfamily)